jgi:hypothetical protein
MAPIPAKPMTASLNIALTSNAYAIPNQPKYLVSDVERLDSIPTLAWLQANQPLTQTVMTVIVEYVIFAMVDP